MPTPAEKPAKQKARILTDTDFRRATCPPGKQRHRLTDSGGLYLEVSPGGSKRWFWKFRIDGKDYDVNDLAFKLAREVDRNNGSFGNIKLTYERV